MIEPNAWNALTAPRLALTAREQEIIRHIARGIQNDRIAYEMGISANTVKTHIGNILRKFGLHNRTQIAMLLTARLGTGCVPLEAGFPRPLDAACGALPGVEPRPASL